MFIPNQTALLSRRGPKNVYSEFTYSAPIKVRCAVVHAKQKNLKTPVRADSSASRGAAEEKVELTKVLFPATVAVRTNDKLTLHGIDLRAVAVEPRFAVTGTLDHIEVDFEAFPS